ncbi:uncharacterized protein METZ01_LOCUS313720, partial [marine metagenome]
MEVIAINKNQTMKKNQPGPSQVLLYNQLIMAMT